MAALLAHHIYHAFVGVLGAQFRPSGTLQSIRRCLEAALVSIPGFGQVHPTPLGMLQAERQLPRAFQSIRRPLGAARVGASMAGRCADHAALGVLKAEFRLCRALQPDQSFLTAPHAGAIPFVLYAISLCGVVSAALRIIALLETESGHLAKGLHLYSCQSTLCSE